MSDITNFQKLTPHVKELDTDWFQQIWDWHNYMIGMIPFYENRSPPERDPDFNYVFDELRRIIMLIKMFYTLKPDIEDLMYSYYSIQSTNLDFDRLCERFDNFANLIILRWKHYLKRYYLTITEIYKAFEGRNLRYIDWYRFIFPLRDNVDFYIKWNAPPEEEMQHAADCENDLRKIISKLKINYRLNKYPQYPNQKLDNSLDLKPIEVEHYIPPQ